MRFYDIYDHPIYRRCRLYALQCALRGKVINLEGLIEGGTKESMRTAPAEHHLGDLRGVLTEFGQALLVRVLVATATKEEVCKHPNLHLEVFTSGHDQVIGNRDVKVRDLHVVSRLNFSYQLS